MQMTDRNGNTDKLNQMMDEYGKGPVCIAFSGGVDSSLLLKIACDNGRKYKTPVYAVTIQCSILPAIWIRQRRLPESWERNML